MDTVVTCMDCREPIPLEESRVIGRSYDCMTGWYDFIVICIVCQESHARRSWREAEPKKPYILEGENP